MVKIEPVLRKNLLLLARAYMRATKVTIGSLSRRVHSDSKFLGLFQSGKVSPSLRKYDEMIGWFEREMTVKGIEMPVLTEIFAPPATTK